VNTSIVCRRVANIAITLLTALAMLWALTIMLQTAIAAQASHVDSSASGERPTFSSADPDHVQDTPLVLAAYQAWFGLGHAFTPYISIDPAVISRHITAALARGIDGFVVDWYGPQVGASNDIDRQFIDEATAELLRQSGTSGFYTALMYDEGTVWYTGAPTTEYTSRVIADLLYARQYFTMPGYLRMNGHPALFVFSYDDPNNRPVDRYINWRDVKDSLGITVILLDQDPSRPKERNDEFSGFYAWVQAGSPWPEDGTRWGKEYLDWFYDIMAREYSDKIMIGGVWVGFDNTLANWGEKRYIWPRCGQTWHYTWDMAAEKGASTVLISTWNDFEEGSDIEYNTRECLLPSIPLTTRPGMQVVYRHTISNTGKFSDTFHITAHSSNLWSVAINPASIMLLSHTETTLMISLTVPPTVSYGLKDWLVITATSELSPSVYNSVVDTTTIVSKKVYLPLLRGPMVGAGLARDLDAGSAGLDATAVVPPPRR
jgi:hypothetical protein